MKSSPPHDLHKKTPTCQSINGQDKENHWMQDCGCGEWMDEIISVMLSNSDVLMAPSWLVSKCRIMNSVMVELDCSSSCRKFLFCHPSLKLGTKKLATFPPASRNKATMSLLRRYNRKGREALIAGIRFS